MALKTSDDDCSITWYLQHNKYFDSIPFVAGLAWIVTKLVPGKDIADDYKPQHLNKDLVYHAPGVALQETQKNYKMWVRLFINV